MRLVFFHSLSLLCSQGIFAFCCYENCENPRLAITKKQVVILSEIFANKTVMLYYLGFSWQ